jgi:hypothetical protein
MQNGLHYSGVRLWGFLQRFDGALRIDPVADDPDIVPSQFRLLRLLAGLHVGSLRWVSVGRPCAWVRNRNQDFRPLTLRR